MEEFTVHANIARSLYYFATISIILLFWVFWLQYRTLKKFVDTTMGLMKSAEISLIFLKVCWSQYGTQFFVTSIGQVCWLEYVAPKISYPVVWTAHGAIFIKQNLRYVLTYDLTCNPNSALPLFITKGKITLIYYILCTCFLPFLRNFSFSTSRLLKILQALKFMISDGCPYELDFSKMKEPKHLCSWKKNQDS